ncbi:hypothetical protein A9Q99_09630 [Gammaproteobacteria bacterium 45_16_T64]|nr:hypothetical protein A9Q99_09630 [Gammaproteobacteria bacterium 45_16_T64]
MAVLHKLIHLLIDWLSKSTEPKDALLCDFDRVRAELMPCDVILVEGRSKADNTLKTITESEWSHSALYIGRLIDLEDKDLRTRITNHFDFEPDMPLVIETRMGQGSIVSPLNSLEREHLRICRPKGLAEKDAQQVVRFAISRLGSYANVLQLFDLFRFFMLWSLTPRNWRRPLFRYTAGKHTKSASAALIAECFDFIQFPILPLVKKAGNNGVQLFRRRPKLCFPADFDRSPYFEIVKYPFIDFASHTGSDLLPWKGNGVVSGEKAEQLSDHSAENRMASLSTIPTPQTISQFDK